MVEQWFLISIVFLGWALFQQFQSKIQDAVPTTIARTIRAAAIVNALALAQWPILAPITPSALWSDISPSVLVLKISPAIPTSTAIKVSLNYLNNLNKKPFYAANLVKVRQ